MLNLYITAIVTLPTVIAPLILGPWLAHFLKVLEFMRITNWNESQSFLYSGSPGLTDMVDEW